MTGGNKLLSSKVDLGPEQGWREIFPSELLGPTRPFVSGDPEGERLRIRYYRDHGDESLVAKAWFGPAAEGPPGFAHGGSIAAVLDETMGFAVWAAGHAVVAGRLTTIFKAPLPLGSVVLVKAFIGSMEGRKIAVTGQIESTMGQVFAEGEGIYIEIDPVRYQAS